MQESCFWQTDIFFDNVSKTWCYGETIWHCKLRFSMHFRLMKCSFNEIDWIWDLHSFGTISKRANLNIKSNKMIIISSLPSFKISCAVIKSKLQLTSSFKNLKNVSKHRFLKKKILLIICHRNVYIYIYSSSCLKFMML